MITLKVESCGDYWINPERFQQDLAAVPPEEEIELDLNNEGPSLSALGILGMLEEHCRTTGRDPKTVSFTRWHNPVEKIPAFGRRAPRQGVSHFLWLCESYITEISPSTHEYRFGMFVGRRTTGRMYMLQNMWRDYRDHCLFSLMSSRSIFDPRIKLDGFNLDDMDYWVPKDERSQFTDWCLSPPIDSIDGHAVHEQYDPNYNTNQDLLTHYHRFDIEIAIETYTRGVCFLPTEKTIRPITAGKPILVHGPRQFLARLRDLGFRTWCDYWDESYDDLEGTDRWSAMKQTIKYISSEQDLNPGIFKIAEYNRQHHQQLMVEHRPS